VASAIILYEAALGVGIATGPLVGDLLGDVSWRGPFFGVAALMAIAFVAVVALLPRIEKPARATSLADPFRALRNPGLLVMAITALLYNFGFFTLLAYAPFPLAMGAHQIGLIFFGWGVCLAIAPVFIAPMVQRRLGTVVGVAVALLAFAVDLAVMGFFVDSKAVLVVGVVVAGLFLGINNTLVTEGVMLVSTVERSTASAAYSFVRFGGGAVAPWLAGKLGETISHQVPFWMGATATALGVCVLMGGRRWLGRLAGEAPAEHGALEAEAVTLGDACPLAHPPRRCSPDLRFRRVWTDGPVSNDGLVSNRLLAPNRLPGVKVLVVGSGAREHALVRSLSLDPAVDAVIAAPANPGIGLVADCRPLDVADPAAVADLAAEVAADLVVIGPEVPLVAGAADAVRAKGIPCFGPSARAARLEGSKAFAKQVMAEAGVPTGMAHVCTTVPEVEAALDAFGSPHVVKDDGLAAGKGVVVCDSREDALAHAGVCLGREGAQVVVEEYLDGPEVSLFCITDGRTVVPLAPAQDFKRVGDGDTGPNTGGMGAYSPLPWVPADLVDQVVERVAQPVVDQLRKQGDEFSGLLYCGLALTSRGVRVIEFNARFGDPET
jgi:MFS family permease/glutathione synthase/RimK-type ligase-like ATP-grasp enzyme